MKVLNTYWFTGGSTVGIVVGEDEVTKEKKAYIGIAKGVDEDQDTIRIMQSGARVNRTMLETIVKDLS